ncbi:MAG: hypothetical protein HY270_20755 [Deltaproteobacteria bacterium]|nr:hypothetical protein [Deltaproteobacteria bacterium]
MIGAFGDERFRAIPFVLTALFAAACVVSGEWRAVGIVDRDLPFPTSAWQRLISAAIACVRALVALALIILVISGVQAIVDNRASLSYAANFLPYEQRADVLRALGCGRSDVALAYYPSDPLNYVFTRMPPASPYLFMLPWIAEVALPEVITSLQSRPAVVSVDLHGQIWGYENRHYMAPLIDFLEQHYTKVLPGLYRSKDLDASCPLPVMLGH